MDERVDKKELGNEDMPKKRKHAHDKNVKNFESNMKGYTRDYKERNDEPKKIRLEETNEIKQQGQLSIDIVNAMIIDVDNEINTTTKQLLAFRTFKSVR